LPEADNVTWKELVRSGDVVPEIADYARANAVNLIVMSTAGKEGILDALRGSVTQQVLRQAHCPLLAVPTT
jgi:nucleotide-binding universal stress UspA family protein